MNQRAISGVCADRMRSRPDDRPSNLVEPVSTPWATPPAASSLNPGKRWVMTFRPRRKRSARAAARCPVDYDMAVQPTEITSR